jgi:hypothetical protein
MPAAPRVLALEVAVQVQIRAAHLVLPVVLGLILVARRLPVGGVERRVALVPATTVAPWGPTVGFVVGSVGQPAATVQAKDRGPVSGGRMTLTTLSLSSEKMTRNHNN